MKKTMEWRIWFLGAAIVGLVPVSASANAAIGKPEATLCNASEEVIFSCMVQRNHKIISLCVTKSSRQGEARVQYRFGGVGAVELSYPSDSTERIDRFKFSGRPLSGGGEYHIRFVNSKFEYTLYDLEAHGGGYSGLMIKADGRQVSHLKCVPGEHSFIAPAGFWLFKEEAYSGDIP